MRSAHLLPAAANMLCLALSVVLCLLVRGGDGQFQEVEPSFCSSSQLVGARCDDTTTEPTPAPVSLESQVNVLRCQSGCLMNDLSQLVQRTDMTKKSLAEDLNILDGFPVSEDVWAFINIGTLKEAEREKVNACRRQCLLFTLVPGFSVALCQAGCNPLVNSFPEACRIGCSLGNMLINEGTADDPDQVPAQPTGTPPTFFDVQSSKPWEFSLNLSAVVPENTTQLQPNGSMDNGRPRIHGFVLQIIIEQNGVNTTHYYYMFDPAVPGSPTFSNFLSSLRCHEMYLSIGVVNFYGWTNFTEPTRTCIPGPYSLTMEPRLVLVVYEVRQGPPASPSLGSIVVHWQSPEFSPIFGYPTYEISASYINASDALNSRCQPDGGDQEFRQRKLSDITSFEIESGPHGNIQLLPQDIGACAYIVTLEALWVGPSVTIPFLRKFQRMYTREVDIVFVPSDQPFVRVTANITNVRIDGFYNFDTIGVQLDPPDNDFYESFNAITWRLSLFDGVQAQTSDLIPPVIEPNPLSFMSTDIRIPPPEVIHNLKLSPLGLNSFYELTVEPVRVVPSERFPVIRRDYLRVPAAGGVQIGSSMARPIHPGPLRNVTITGCSIDSVLGNTSLQVAWELPEMSFGMLANCSLNISVIEEAVENAALIFVPGASQSPEARSTSLPLPSRMTYSSYLFSVAMMCVNEHGLRTELSTSNSFSGSDCALVEPPTPFLKDACTFEHCTKKTNLCTIPGAGGNCTTQKTSCNACYFAKEERPLPSKCAGNLKRYKCAGRNGCKLEMCLKRWGNCVQKAFKRIYGKPTKELKNATFFKCPEFPCNG